MVIICVNLHEKWTKSEIEENNGRLSTRRDYLVRKHPFTKIMIPRGGGGGGGTPPKLGYNAQHKLKIWTLRDLKTSEKGGLKDLKRVFDKF